MPKAAARVATTTAGELVGLDGIPPFKSADALRFPMARREVPLLPAEIAGAGSIELAGAALAIANQTVPATVNFDKPIDGCRLNFLRQSRPAKIDCLVSGAHTVGGQSAAVVLKRYQP